jgi:hypothetical protein
MQSAVGAAHDVGLKPGRYKAAAGLPHFKNGVASSTHFHELRD